MTGNLQLPVSRKMLEHYSHIRMAAKRVAPEAIAKPVLTRMWCTIAQWAAGKTTVAN
jgi:hypothetical protein